MITLSEINEAYKNASNEEKQEFLKTVSPELKEYLQLVAKYDALLEEMRKNMKAMHNFFTGARLMKMQRMYRFKEGGW